MRVGIAGAGTILADFLAAAHHVGIYPVAICASRRSAHLDELALTSGITEVFDSYEEMLRAASVDTVYVAVPNSLHFEFGMRALQHGKHVIIEKPFASDAAQAKRLAELSEQHDRFVFEAMPTAYNPNYLELAKQIHDIGAIKIVTANYSQLSRRYAAFRAGELPPVFDPAMSGGAAMDLNVYNVHFAVGLFGAPNGVTYRANLERGIDTSGVLMLDYDTFVCVLAAGKDSAAPASFTIQGDAGYISSRSPMNALESFDIALTDRTSRTFALSDQTPRLAFELEAFRTMIAETDHANMRRMLDRSIVVQDILDQARLQTGIQRPTSTRAMPVDSSS